eukprot:4725733-Pyramimonas_sp.AAC.1
MFSLESDSPRSGDWVAGRSLALLIWSSSCPSLPLRRLRGSSPISACATTLILHVGPPLITGSAKWVHHLSTAGL